MCHFSPQQNVAITRFLSSSFSHNTAWIERQSESNVSWRRGLSGTSRIRLRSLKLFLGDFSSPRFDERQWKLRLSYLGLTMISHFSKQLRATEAWKTLKRDSSSCSERRPTRSDLIKHFEMFWKLAIISYWRLAKSPRRSQKNSSHSDGIDEKCVWKVLLCEEENIQVESAINAKS